MHGKAITVLEMDHPIVEFMVLCETPYNNGEVKPSRLKTFRNYCLRIRKLSAVEGELVLKNCS